MAFPHSPKHLIQFWSRWVASGNHIYLMMLALLIVWWIVISNLMIIDVWDESTARIFFSTEAIANMSTWELLVGFWLQELPIDIYRPLGSSLFVIFNRLTDGEFDSVRYGNAVLVALSVFLFSQVLLQNFKVSASRVLIFYSLLLFSSAAIITSTWNANIYDASCLFFLSIATFFYFRESFLWCGIALTLSIFCKESYVLLFPFFLLLAFENKNVNRKTSAILILGIAIVSIGYWWLRLRFIPLGSEADIHGFQLRAYFSSLLSFLGGFPFQFSKFTLSSPHLWVGLLVLVFALASLQNNRSRIAIATTLLLASIVYWGMFGYQGNDIMTADNFAGRLFLIPLTAFLFLLCRDAKATSVIAFSVLSIAGAVITFQDHKTFQQTYVDIYELGIKSNIPILIQFPERPLEDSQHNIFIAKFFS